MSERKSINKYYPPDYDPSKLPKKQKGLQPKTQKVRLMAPYSMRCLKCNEYIAHRRKFNARKEDSGEKYMGFKIWRFHITCPVCNNDISFKTNYKNAGFTPDQGAVRNYESTKTVVEKEISGEETPEETLQRLEREEQANEKYQLEKEKRAKNPFWKQNEQGDGNKMENLQDKLDRQMKQQEMNEHLEQLHERMTTIDELGGADVLSSTAKNNLERAKRDIQSIQEEEDENEVDEAFKKFRQDEVQRDTIRLSKPTVTSKITVKRRKAEPTSIVDGYGSDSE